MSPACHPYVAAGFVLAGIGVAVTAMVLARSAFRLSRDVDRALREGDAWKAKGFVFEWTDEDGRPRSAVVVASMLAEARAALSREGFDLGERWRAKPFTPDDRPRVVWSSP